MDQLTVRGFDAKLSASIRRISRQENISLNKAALKLLQKGAGLTEDNNGMNTVSSSLDHLIGSWTPEEADEIDSALREFESIDESAWK